MPSGARVFGYPVGWLSSDLVAGVTLAAYAIPVSLAYATLAGLPPQVRVYGYLMGGLGYALAGSSRYLAIGPTSAISLMMAGTVGAMASDNVARYAEIATATAVGVGVFCLIAWVFRLSVLVKLISDSVLTGFKAGATKHHQTIDPRRELLGLAAANIATAAVGGYPVAGGLSQTAVNEGAGARSRVSLVFASLTLALCLLFFTTLLANLPKAMLAAVVLMAVSGLVDFRAFARMWRASRVDFLSALAALVGVLLLGILEGILLAALISVLLLIALSLTPHVAFLGRIPGTAQYSDLQRHPDNEPLVGVLAFRPEGSLIYLNAEYVLAQVLARLDMTGAKGVRNVVGDLSASSVMDLAGARMLAELHENLANRGIGLTVTNAHGRVRDLLRAERLDDKIQGIARGTLLETELHALSEMVPRAEA